MDDRTDNPYEPPRTAELSRARDSRGSVPASLYRRLAAVLIDTAIWYLLLLFLVIPIDHVFRNFLFASWTSGMPEKPEETALALILFMSLGVLLLLLGQIGCELSRWRGTPGKRLLGLRVIDTHGNDPPARRVIVRNLLKLLFLWIWPLGIVALCFAALRTGMRLLPHDAAAGTQVVRRQHPGSSDPGSSDNLSHDVLIFDA